MKLVDPLVAADWDNWVTAQPRATVFHSAGWARVLRYTYGHRPFYFARYEGQQLTGVLPVMEVSSWLTGRRGVSLPFTDLCPALQSAGGEGENLYQSAMEVGRQRRWKYLECRGLDAAWVGSRPSLSFYGHKIDLGVGQEKLFQGLEGSLRRGVRKAEREGVKIDFDTGEQSMRTFFPAALRDAPASWTASAALALFFEYPASPDGQGARFYCHGEAGQQALGGIGLLA
jgi:hypothetical protein